MVPVTNKKKISVKPVDEAAVSRLAQELKILPLLARLFIVRGLTDAGACGRFFSLDITQLHDPFLFRDMEKAVQRIRLAIDNKEKIVIYGDYDVDGITGTALLVRVLRRLGAQCGYYLPNRLTEGYGISTPAIQAIAGDGVRLVISVDCGVTAVDAVAAAKTAGLDIIITDHHEPHEALPAADALLDPKVGACGYPDGALAGVGVALKLCQALALAADRPPQLWMDYLDLRETVAADRIATQATAGLAARGVEQVEQTAEEEVHGRG